jgi:thiol-disulfide isomerase/thioredoxin
MSLRSAVIATLVLSSCVKAPTEKKAAPPFDLPTVVGSTLSLASLKGKVVILDFWATWCGPCIEEIPHYKEFLKENQPRGVEVVGMVVQSGEREEIAEFVKKHGMTYPQVMGTDALQDAYGGNLGLPVTFVIDAQGMIEDKIVGSPPGKFRRLQETVDRLLPKS